MTRDWFYLGAAALVETGWASALKAADSVLAWAVTIALLALSLVLALKAARRLPATTVDTVFVGLGAAGTVLADAVVFGAPLHAGTLVFIALLLAGVIGLKAGDSRAKAEEES